MSGMRMAKASRADMDMATSLASILDSLFHQHPPAFPMEADAEDDDPFDADDPEHCRRAIELLGKTLQTGSISRVVWGMGSLVNEKSNILDPNASYLRLHPVLQRHHDLGRALDRVLLELPHPYSMTIDLERGSGTVTLYDAEHDDITPEFDGDFSEKIANCVDEALALTKPQHEPEPKQEPTHG